MQKKRQIPLIIILLIASTLFITNSMKPTFAIDTNVKVEPQDNIFYTNTTSIGDTFTISIVVEDVSGFYGWELYLTWTAGLINCTAETINYALWTAFLGPWVPIPIDNAAGEYHQSLTARSPATPIDGTFWLANLTFQIIQAPPEGNTLSTGLNIEPAPGYTYCLLNQVGDEIPHDFIHGTYQFISSVAPPPPPPEDVHDIAVTSIQPSKHIMPQNYLLPINVTVENQGSFPETFDLIVNISDTIVSTFANINLSVSESATVGFVWDNTGFEMGNYTLTAYASIVTNETETEDNTLEDWIFITILGDTNGDQQVDAKDAVAVGFAFGARPGESDWNGDADLNDDGYVNIKDVIIMGTHFGQSWP